MNGSVSFIFERDIEYYVLPKATAGYRQQPQKGQKSSQGQQGEHVQKCIQTQEDSEDHQL